MKMRLPVWFLAGIVLVLAGQGCVSLDGGNKSSTTGPAGMFLSADKGESWQAISLLPLADGVKSLSAVDVYGVVEDPQDPQSLYWLTRTQGLLYSYDGGRSWRQSVEPFNSGFVYSVAIHPQDKCTLLATNGRQIFKTVDCNRSWTEIYREADVSRSIRTVAYAPFSPHEIFAAESSGDILKSEDSGQSWRLASEVGNELSRLFLDTNEAGLMYAASSKNGLYRSRDGGKTWVQIKNQLKQFPKALEYRRMYLYPTRPGQLYWVSQYGILVSRNAGDDWESINLITPPGGVNIFGFAVNPKNDQEMYYSATVGTRSTFYRSIDGGKNWVTRKMPSGQIPTFLRVQPETGGIYLGFSVPPKK
ncbi:MAG: Glycosyl hydrolase, BNR repeat-containing protein [Candidatus Magasanikbacteria bacterium GW2011_GWA2_56_11]|uniref:Glycosyl hydrolase, BNR repeat-containing protein n=1 Tax=Candidatus Magasanikbacteria bacterium GW2011_GWA2_56_11 TaxID=1619044 RepID=A0A0G1YHW9_9BACT|nr:MAG: Glycosyl hydrolase, BNR repeat-containing protein [Candidatus Magasanikbacteria bacterium GW2011_GWA2_56_11]